MLVFATSDKGGTGRSITSSNVAYRQALQGKDVSYLDFDFGSPTAGAMYSIDKVDRGSPGVGLHSYLQGHVPEPESIDIWAATGREEVRNQSPGAGRLVLFTGDRSGGEFPGTHELVNRCIRLFLRLEEEYDLTLVDLSAGRSYAIDIALQVMADPRLSTVLARWLVFHRWTKQHILAASDLVFGHRGILETGVARGHAYEPLRQALRFVRTAVVDPGSPELAGLRAEQVVWLREFNTVLRRLAHEQQVGETVVLGAVPLDPLLQWREQLITDEDVNQIKVANQATVEAFVEIGDRLSDDSSWEGL